MNKLVILLLFGLVIFSGCVIPGFPGGEDVNKATQGLIIKTWEPELLDSNAFLPNQPINLKLTLENIGSSEAKRIKVKTNSEFDLNQCSVSGSILTGNQHNCFFSGKVPSLFSGLKTTKNLLVTVDYLYITEAAKTINVRSLEDVRLLKDTGLPLINPSNFIQSKNTPLQISIEAKTPVTVFESEGKFLSPMLVTISNVGGGIVCFPNCDSSANRNKFSYKLEIIGDGVRFSNEHCKKTSDEHSLGKGESYTIPCTAIESTKPQFETTPIIKVTSEYGYETQADASIIVDNRGTL